MRARHLNVYVRVGVSQRIERLLNEQSVQGRTNLRLCAQHLIPARHPTRVPWPAPSGRVPVRPGPPICDALRPPYKALRRHVKRDVSGQSCHCPLVWPAVQAPSPSLLGLYTSLSPPYVLNSGTLPILQSPAGLASSLHGVRKTSSPLILTGIKALMSIRH
jgi:hypothetical protein